MWLNQIHFDNIIADTLALVQDGSPCWFSQHMALSLVSFSKQDAVVLREGRPFQEALSCCPTGNHLSPLPLIRAGENVGPEGSELWPSTLDLQHNVSRLMDGTSAEWFDGGVKHLRCPLHFFNNQKQISRPFYFTQSSLPHVGADVEITWPNTTPFALVLYTHVSWIN